MNDSDIRWLLPLCLAAAAGAAIWFMLLEDNGTADVAPPVHAPEQTDPELGPVHPVAPPSMQTGTEALVPLPPLDDSDAYFKLALADVFGAGVEALLANEALIERFVTTIDNLPRAHVSEKIRPAGRLGSEFQADATDDEEVFALSAENYARYDGIVTTFIAAEDEELVDVYRRFYPLFQEAYVGIGYPNGYFNDRAVEVIDHLLNAPQPAPPVYLKRSNVLFEFADPDLEALSAGQKLMIRIGPANADKVRARLRSIRERIANEPRE